MTAEETKPPARFTDQGPPVLILDGPDWFIEAARSAWTGTDGEYCRVIWNRDGDEHECIVRGNHRTHRCECSLALRHGDHDQSDHGNRDGGDWADKAKESEASLRESIDSPVTSSTTPGGDFAAQVSVEEHENGTQTVSKTFPDEDFQGRDSVDQADAEHLGSVTASALDVSTPAVVSTGYGQVTMSYMDGRTGAEVYGDRPPSSVLDSDDGRLIGLQDAITGNGDRNPGNWMVDDDGSLHALDHGSTFGVGGAEAGATSPFAAHFLNETGTDWADTIDMSPGDMATLRGRLESLESQFAGHEDWYQDMMYRFSALEGRATGTRDRL